MSPTEILKHEHQIILLVLKGAERLARRATKNAKADLEAAGKMVDFFRNFVDRCHHTKEEKQLFPRLGQRGVPVEGGPIGQMLKEHQDGRAKVSQIAGAAGKLSAGDAAALPTLASSLLDYVLLLRLHISKEDNILFPLADRALTEADQNSLLEAFEKIEAEEMGEGVHEKYHQLAHELAES